MVFAVSYKHALVACSLLLCPVSAYAGTPSLNITLSHTDTSELKPISIARAQFLPDIDDNPYSYFDRIEEDHNRGGCQKNGFQYTRDNCPAPRILKNKCPFGTGYADCYCAGSPTCSGSNNHTSNPYPSSTGASETSCRNCKGDTLYNWSCNSSACSGYMIYSSCPAHGNCSRCCDGYYKLNSCDSGYEISGSGGSAKCILSETCFGDTAKDTSLGYSCSSCVNKSGQTLYTCSCTGSCSLSSCPSNGYCSSDCKGKYCLNSCKSGYSVSGNSCVYICPHNCSLNSCPEGSKCTYESCSDKYCLGSCQTGYTMIDGKCAYGCGEYELLSCPTGAASCSKCPYDNSKLKINGCKTGYSVSGNTCIPTPCPAGYSTDISSCADGYTLRPSTYQTQIWSGNEKCRTCACELTETSCTDYGKNSLDGYEATASYQRDGTTYYKCLLCNRTGGTAAGYATCLGSYTNNVFRLESNAQPRGKQISCGGKTYYEYCGCESNGWKMYESSICGPSGYPYSGSSHRTYTKAGLDYTQYYHRGVYCNECSDSKFAEMKQTHNGCCLYYCSQPGYKVVDAPTGTCGVNKTHCCCPADFSGEPNPVDCVSYSSRAAYPDNQP